MGFKSSQISKSKAHTGHYASRSFFTQCISKLFNEENRKKYLFVRILHKITFLYLNKCACKWEFHLILFL